MEQGRLGREAVGTASQCGLRLLSDNGNTDPNKGATQCGSSEDNDGSECNPAYVARALPSGL